MTCRITDEALANYRVNATGGRVVVFDTETTGITHDDEIIQLSAAEYVCGELKRTLNLYVVPSCMIHPEAEAVHHITMPFLVEHGIPPCEALGVEGENSHNALDDTLACGSLFFDLVRRVPDAGEYVYESIWD